MLVNQNGIVAVTLIVSVTLVGVIALTRNTDTKIGVQFAKNLFITIESKGSLNVSEKNKVDCLPGEENSQLRECQ